MMISWLIIRQMSDWVQSKDWMGTAKHECIMRFLQTRGRRKKTLETVKKWNKDLKQNEIYGEREMYIKNELINHGQKELSSYKWSDDNQSE